jgi:hypothetical protein
MHGTPLGDDLTRDAVLFRYWRALDLSVAAIRAALTKWFLEPAQTLTIGELLRLARTRGFLLDADQWLPFFATRFDPPEMLDGDRCFEQAQAFTIRAQVLLTTLASIRQRDERARRELAGDSESLPR